MRLIVSPLLLVLVIGAVAALSVPAQQVWLAPSIASAAFTQVFTAQQPSARPYAIVLGQLIGIASGFAGTWAARAAGVPQFMGDHDITWTRVLAIVIAVAIAATVQELLKARSPAGGTTAVVVAVGVETANLGGAVRLAVGIALVAVLGEAARHVMLRIEKARPSA